MGIKDHSLFTANLIQNGKFSLYSLFKNTVFLIWLFCSLALLTVFTSIWAFQKTYMVAKLSTEITANTIKHKKEIQKTISKIKAKARLKRMIIMLPFAGAAAGIYFEESEFQEWLLDNPDGTRADYLCAVSYTHLTLPTKA